MEKGMMGRNRTVARSVRRWQVLTRISAIGPVRGFCLPWSLSLTPLVRIQTNTNLAPRWVCLLHAKATVLVLGILRNMSLLDLLSPGEFMCHIMLFFTALTQ